MTDWVVHMRHGSWLSTPTFEARGDSQLMVLRIDHVCLRDFSRTGAADVRDQLVPIPACLPLDARVVVLDLAAVGREPRRAPLSRGDDDHRLGLRDRETFRRVHDVADRLALARGRGAVGLRLGRWNGYFAVQRLWNSRFDWGHSTAHDLRLLFLHGQPVPLARLIVGCVLLTAVVLFALSLVHRQPLPLLTISPT